MTSHTLNSFRDQPIQDLTTCAFCQIIQGRSDSFKVYEDEDTLAFLDILPMRRGHTLVVPKPHVQQISDLTPDQSSSLLRSVVKVSRGLGSALKDDRMQVITNQIYAQIVPHVHFHIVPAPTLPGTFKADSKTGEVGADDVGKKPLPSSSPTSLMSLFGHGREEIDEEEASALCQEVRRWIEKDDGRPRAESRL
ncbi:HIT-like protein [Violaceomyces palustris]|uniref:HIT-like protein n=1 Tax=Violaceomyces palustris TaxID=1673888 RepID=A0ACD0NQD4_9BASI|nr:HIT-like protein [Violaceomyces palustris]